MTRVSLALAALLACLPLHRAMADVVYRGQDAVELKCAAILILGQAMDERLPTFSPEERVVMGAMTLVFLERIPGTEAQKKRAVDQILRRMIVGRTDQQITAEMDRSIRNCEALVR